jgi:hypothetical protein
LVEGIPFPDSEIELRNFVDTFRDVDDEQALAMFASAFDRPAFRTPFQQESNLHAFQQAIDDTIRVLSTGIWQTLARPRLFLTSRNRIIGGYRAEILMIGGFAPSSTNPLRGFRTPDGTRNPKPFQPLN